MVRVSTAALFSEHWHRVKDLKPRLAPDVDVCRHVYRDVPCYVLHRRSTGAFHRVDIRSFELIGNLDGSLSVDEVWNRAIALQGDEAPTQPELMNLLAQLHEASLLSVSRKLNAEQLFARADEQQSKASRQRYLNPLYMRFALFDPDRLLNWLNPIGKYVFCRAALFVWLALMALALFKLLPAWPSLQRELTSFDMFSPSHALMFFLVYPVLKALHEFGHALALKRFGGEVHELGIALMVLLPIPYVDASAAAALADKRQRMIVSAAGIAVELAIAALATLVWSASSGILHELALMLMVIGGLSTVFFNGNPLLKFDGYYLLADAIEIPNLESRSKRYSLAVCRALMFGMQDIPVTNDTRERVWLVSYAVLSTVYRLGLMLTIAYMLSGQFFFFGVVLAAWIAIMLIGLPVWRFLRFLLTESSVSRPRPLLISGACCALCLTVLFGLPVPLNTVTDGVVWLPEDAILRVAGGCEVTELLVAPGSRVASGAALFRCENQELDAQLRELQAQLDELSAQRAGLALTDPVKHEVLRNDMFTVQARLQSVRDQIAGQTVVAALSGELVVTGNRLLEGRYLDQGEVAAYVVPPTSRTVRVAVQQTDIAHLKEALRGVEIQFAEQTADRKTYVSAIERQTPKAGYTVASAALTTVGGGEFAADPAGDGRTVLEPVFDVELRWPDDAPPVNVGSHVRVKFLHEPQPVAGRLMARLQRAFLARINA